MITNTNNVYIYFNIFILFEVDTLLTRVYLEFVSIIKVAIIVYNYFGYYKYIDNSSHFSKFYYNIIIEKKIPEFGFANYITF